MIHYERCNRCPQLIMDGEVAAYQQGFMHWSCLTERERAELAGPRK